MYYLIGLGVSLGLFALYVSTRPSSSRIERSLTIHTSPAVLYGLINDFHQWSAWSPWEKMDPAMKKTYEGAESGVGAVYGWTGNSKVGQGSMAIVDSTPESRVEIAMTFLKPFPSASTVIFTLEPEGAATRVTWAMEGARPFMVKAMAVFMDMDALIGKDFAAGLAALRDAAATRA